MASLMNLVLLKISLSWKEEGLQSFSLQLSFSLAYIRDLNVYLDFRSVVKSATRLKTEVNT